MTEQHPVTLGDLWYEDRIFTGKLREATVADLVSALRAEGVLVVNPFDQLFELQGKRFAVVRGSNDPKLDGKWFDLAELEPMRFPYDGAVDFRPTGQFERRDDGMLAAVLRPEAQPFPPAGDVS